MFRNAAVIAELHVFDDTKKALARFSLSFVHQLVSPLNTFSTAMEREVAQLRVAARPLTP